MARKLYSVKVSDKKQLIKAVALKFGKKISASFQCELLAAEINQQAKKTIGANTLRRFLGFLEHNFSPSLQTLDILSDFAGYHDWDTFKESNSQQNFEPLSLDQEAILHFNFYEIEVRKESDMNYHNVCRNIAYRILANEPLLRKMSPGLAKNPVSQVYFFERFPYIDGLCNHYKNCINLYLQKETEDAKIFGNALLLLSAFLAKNKKEMNRHVDILSQYTLHKNMHPFLVARFLGSKILFKVYNEKDIDDTMNEIRSWKLYFDKINLNDFWNYVYFEHMICSYLNLAGLFDESFEIISSIRKTRAQFEIEDGYREALDIIDHISAHKRNPVKFKAWCRDTKSLEKCNFIYKKFLSLQVLAAQSSLEDSKRHHKKIATQMEELIQSTGFVHFRKFIPVLN